MKIKKYLAFNFETGKMTVYNKPPQGVGGSKCKYPTICIEAWITGGLNDDGSMEVVNNIKINSASDCVLNVINERIL